MKEPQRWLEDRRTSAELRQILESSTAAPPLPEELHAQLSAVAVRLASQTLLAQVGGMSLGRKLLLALGGSGKALGVAALIGAAGAGTYVVSRERVSPSVHAPSAPARPVARALPGSVTLAPLASASSAAIAPREEPRTRVVAAHEALGAAPSAVRGISDVASPIPASSGEESIAAEAKLLETARSFLGDSPALALQLTEQHRQLHPAAQLSAERELIAIDALLRLGRRQEAEQRAAPRLAQAPDSLYARRLRQLLTSAAPAAPKSDNH